MSEFLERISHFSPKRLALLADELQSRVMALEARLGEAPAHSGEAREAIAIVGIGCRFPGGARTPEDFWALVRDGVDAITEVPPERWAIDDYYDADPDAVGKMNTRWGGFVGAVDGFDPHFFGISPREARSMDPQQRLLLEVAWEALEHAGIAADRIEGSRTGVFVGLSAGDYFQMLRDGGIERFDAYTASGIAHSIASGRLSYVLGARGPSVSIDTACSSSLMAIHEAVQSLRRGECDTALAGGVNLILTPDVSVALSRAHMMAPDGRCKAFDARADGFVRSEGCGVLVLKRLSDAQAAGDSIVALIRGSAANQDGRSNGLTAPNGPSQEAVLREALADAGVAPEQVGFVEAHGTGTSLGDPIEVQALAKVFGEPREGQPPLLIGSVKANVGHMEAAAGVGGLIKLAMALRHGQVPGQPHLRRLNPYIPWDELAVGVPTALTAWPATGGAARLGGVSSFGFSGTNVHLVLEQAPEPVTAAAASPVERPLHLLALSTRQEGALRQLAAAYADTLERGEASLADVAFSAHTGRAPLAQRLALVAADAPDAARRLRAHLAGASDADVLTGSAGARAPRLAFLFTGQGAQYAGMARELHASEPVFRAALERCAAWLDARLERPLLSVLFEPASDGEGPAAVDDTAFTQPALFAVEYALAQLWLSWGLRPAAVMGHSVGEYVAACLAGVFSLEDALLLISERGRLMGRLPRDGSMLAVMAGEARVAALIAPWSRDVSIAAINGPSNVVVSGLTAAIEAIEARLREEDLRSVRLKVSHAFHSPLMQPMLAEFAQVAATVRYQAPGVELISNVTGRAAGAEVARAQYWVEHVRAAVQFAPAVQTLMAGGVEVFLEIGPHPTLLGLAQGCVPAQTGVWLPSLRRGRGDWAQMLDSLARLHSRGVPIDWAAFDAGRTRRRVVLPRYPFQRERYWAPDDFARVAAPAVRLAAAAHPVLGEELRQSLTSDRLFESHWGPALQPYLRDHRIQGALLLPSPVYMDMARAAAQLRFGEQPVEIRDFVVRRAQALEGDAGVAVQVVLGAPEGEACALRINAFDEGEDAWVLNASAQLAGVAGAAPTARETPDAVAARLTETVPVEAYYGWLRELGLDFGPLFRGVEQIRRGDGEVLARMRWPEGLAAAEGSPGHPWWHPAALDACFHVIGAGLPRQGAALEQAFLLLHVDRIRLYRAPGAACWNHVRLHALGAGDLATRETFSADLWLMDDAGAVLAVFEGMHFKRARPQALAVPGRVPAAVRRMLHEVVWREAPLGEGSLSPAGIARAVLPRLEELAARHGLDRYAEFLPQLDALASDYVRQALERLGLATSPGAVLDGVSQLGERLGVLPRHARLFARMLSMLVEDGVLERRGEDHVLKQWPAPGDPDARQAALREQYPEAAAELDLTARCARELAEVLRGQADPLALLFPGGSLADTERLYQHSPPAQVYNGAIADALAAIARAWPAGRALRVLEIGAGTGSTTHHVLSRLTTEALEYTFTDVSPLFLHRAREKFAHCPFMRYQVLDIGGEPAAQGLDEGAYDVVIGANVLHATPDLDVTMGHVGRLLAPGGTLVLLEGTTPQRFGDLTVGLLEGWWAFGDTARRQYALMPRERWIELFTQHGLSEPTALPGDTPHPVLQQQAVLLARKPEAPANPVPDAPSARRWLLQPDMAGLGEALAHALRARGDEAVLLPAQAGALAAALREPCDGVIALQALDVQLREDQTAATLERQQQGMIEGLLGTVQALATSGNARSPRLWLVTRGAQPARADEGADAAQATAWGMGHVVAAEYPELRCVRLDLDRAHGDAECVRRLLAELRAQSPEDQIALRGEARLVRRLVRHASPAPAGEPRLDPGRSYLVTGGLRGLGLRVAEWLAEQGARHLVLMGRQAPDERARAAIERLRAGGVTVLAARGDVSLAADVERVLDEAATLAPLAGVVHAAGVLDDGVISAQSWPRFATVMGPKVLGSWNLHTLCRDLDFLVLFSSGASLAGPPGQANHAAANAFEDALAWYRQARGLPTVSINWGPWAEIGAAADRHLDRPGSLRAISPTEGLAALRYAMRQARPGALFEHAQLAVLDSDWSHLAERRADGQGVPTLFAELVRAHGSGAPAAAVAGGVAVAETEASLRERLAAAPANRRRTLLRERVSQLTTKVLGVPRGEVIDVTEPLRQLGLDSLMAVELRNLLGQAVGRTLPATLTFDHPSVAALTEHLAREVFADLMPTADAAQAPAAEPPAPGAPGAHALDELSEDELAKQLMSRLDGLGSEETL